MAPQAFLATFAGHLACKLLKHLKHSSGRAQLQLQLGKCCKCCLYLYAGRCCQCGKWRLLDFSIGCNLFYELQLAISVRGECVNFVCKTFTINCNRSLSACHTHRHKERERDGEREKERVRDIHSVKYTISLAGCTVHAY